MVYLREILKRPVVDANGEEMGTLSDLAIATGEVFPRVTSLAFIGPNKTPFMISWRKYVKEFDGDAVHLNVSMTEVRFSYLQEGEVLLYRDLLDKQIVDTQGMKVVRVNDLKLSDSSQGLRLLGADTGALALLRGIARPLERGVKAIAKAIGRPIKEKLIAWNYMELLERDMSQIKLSVSHKRLQELHPADVADILENLDPHQRQRVFEQLDNSVAAEAISELEEEYQADVIEDMSSHRGAALLTEMDPDDAADIIGDLPYDKAERLLRLMGMEEESTVRSLLGYKDEEAGGIMTTDVFTCNDEWTVEEAIAALRELGDEGDDIHYVYTVTANGVLTGVLSLRKLVICDPKARLDEISYKDVISCEPNLDREECTEIILKYDLLALPVVDERGMLLGIVTVDDAMEVMEEEHEEVLHRRSLAHPLIIGVLASLLIVIGVLVFMLLR